jgi:methionine-rich copper-binding protein CopC
MKKVTLVAAALAVTLLGGSALAHTSIAESNPADNSTIEALPEEVSIRFGNATIPAPQPAQLTDATLVLVDPCGARADNEDAQWDETTSTITATTADATSSGRFEMQWSGTSTDGDAQAGVVDFVVSGGPECALVQRTDAADDVDLGFDITNVTSRPTASGASVSVALAASPACKTFAAGSGRLLTIAMDANWDDAVDYTGDFTCKVKRVRKNGRVVKVPVYRLAVTKSGDEAPSVTFKARRSGPKVLTVAIPRTILEDAETGSLDLYVSSETDSDECDEETSCLDRAPDLGLVRAL